jgi:uncharacterized iron-regulated membrane protein
VDAAFSWFAILLWMLIGIALWQLVLALYDIWKQRRP